MAWSTYIERVTYGGVTRSGADLLLVHHGAMMVVMRGCCLRLSESRSVRLESLGILATATTTRSDKLVGKLSHKVAEFDRE